MVFRNSPALSPHGCRDWPCGDRLHPHDGRGEVNPGGVVMEDLNEYRERALNIMLEWCDDKDTEEFYMVLAMAEICCGCILFADEDDRTSGISNLGNVLRNAAKLERTELFAEIVH